MWRCGAGEGTQGRDWWQAYPTSHGVKGWPQALRPTFFIAAVARQVEDSAAAQGVDFQWQRLAQPAGGGGVAGDFVGKLRVQQHGQFAAMGFE